jgi:hypothetical protein
MIGFNHQSVRSAPGLLLAALLLLVTALAPEAAAQSPSSPEAVTRIYHIQFLEMPTAATIADKVCSGEHPDLCSARFAGDRALALTAPEPIHRQFAQLLAERDLPPASQKFEVILLAAARTGTTSGDLPAHAARALEDLEGFLPFSSYRLLDTGWIMTSGHASVTLGDAGSFDAKLSFMGDPTAGKLLVEHFVLSHRDFDRVEGHVIYSDERLILSSSFGIDVGETVVVGSSKLDGGDEAVVVLLTALK